MWEARLLTVISPVTSQAAPGAEPPSIIESKKKKEKPASDHPAVEAAPIAYARARRKLASRDHAGLRVAAAPIACARARTKPASPGRTPEPAQSPRRSPATAAGGSRPREDARTPKPVESSRQAAASTSLLIARREEATPEPVQRPRRSRTRGRGEAAVTHMTITLFCGSIRQARRCLSFVPTSTASIRLV